MSKVQSVDRALSILDILAENPEGMSITELSANLNLAKSTTHRLLSALLDRRYVVQNVQTGRYGLGMQSVVLASSVLNHIDIRAMAKEDLVTLTNQTNEVTHLCIRDREEVIYIDKVESPRTIRMYSQIGKRAMLHCTGVGKILLSGLKKEEVDHIIDRVGLPRFTQTTITERHLLHEELHRIKQCGYAIDENEHEEGIRCIAAPVHDYQGRLIAAISLAGPADRVTKERVEHELVELILQTSKNISNKMGFVR